MEPLFSSSDHSQTAILDLLIIGGGINGTGIAADAAGRGLSVCLCEQEDLAYGTSWKSSKLIHGGLRYLEYYEFNLVRKALREREILLNKAPHLIRPLPFVMPYEKQLRPAWLIRLGLFLYDHLGRRKLLPTTKKINLATHPAGIILKPDYQTGFLYFDCYVDDARLVIANAMQAKQLGATILPHTRFIAAKRGKDFWEIELQNTVTGEIYPIAAKAIVNAAGPWVEQVLKNDLQIKSHYGLSLVKGSHIVVPKLYDGDFAFILQNSDKRIIFVIPFANDFSLIGTTDVAFTGDPNDAKIDPSEIQYLCDSTNHYFKKVIAPADIVWTYSGVRPLKHEDTENPAAISRDYSLELLNDAAPLLNILGGKITTYRELAEEALALLKPYFPDMKNHWTGSTPLPGGDMPQHNFAEFYQKFQHDFAWLPVALAQHLAQCYGSKAYLILNGATSVKNLGKDFGAGLYEKEVRYLYDHEWARTAEDILWRRTKLGLTFPTANIGLLENFLKKLAA